MNTSYFCYKDFTTMDSMIGEKERDVWRCRAILMAEDKYAPSHYFPPVPMDIENLYYLRRN